MRHRPLHAFQLPASPALRDAFAAALEGSGPAVLPLPPELPAAQLQTLIDGLRPEVLITPRGTARLRGGAGVPDDTALVIATSGTTGEPKGVELPGQALEHSARATLSRLDAPSGARWLACLPPDHIAGAQALVRSIVGGSDPIYLPPSRGGFDPEAALESGADYVPLVPTMLDRLLDRGADLSAFRAILLGGSAVAPALVERGREAGGTLLTTYGMTETCGGCVYDGLPLDGVHVALSDNGRIRLSGSTLFSGYRLQPELTGAAMDGSWLLTQDLGEWVDGRLRVRGRADDIIVTGGYNVVPAEVGSLLEDHPGIADVAVVGRPDPEWGERVVAVIVPVQATAPPSLADVREYVRTRAAAHLAPREVDIVAAIPLLGSGKPDREALRRGVGSRNGTRVGNN